MKHSINLLIGDHVKEKSGISQVLFISTLALFLLVLLVGGSIAKAQKVKQLGKELGDLNLQREKINQGIAKLSGVAGFQRPLERQVLPERLQMPSIRWAPIFEELRSYLPKGVWLTQIESFTSQDAQGYKKKEEKTVRMTGFTETHGEVEGFLFSLEGTRYWKNIRLVFAQKIDGGSTPRVEFQITARMP